MKEEKWVPTVQIIFKTNYFYQPKSYVFWFLAQKKQTAKRKTQQSAETLGWDDQEDCWRNIYEERETNKLLLLVNLS